MNYWNTMNKTLGTVIFLSMIASSSFATNWWTQTPTIVVGTTILNVKNFGALGDGVHDDTAAIQKAIDSLPSSGGTVVVPDGNYMINALVAVNLRSHMRLSLYGNAYLKALPNNVQRYWIVKAWNVNNVEIVGGNYVGERDQHTGVGGEWGFGINISGSSAVYVHDLQVSNCWGDGLLVGGIGSGSTLVRSTNVTLNRVKSSNNRRQGLTIAPSTYVYVVNSSFTDQNGTAPQAGIDFEPQTQGTESQIRVENSVMSNNVGNGVEMHYNVSNVVFNAVTTQNNKGFGIFVDDANSIEITNSNLSENYLFGVRVADVTNDVKILDSSIMWNGDAWFYAHNKSIYTKTTTPRDISIASTTTNITPSGNQISPTH